MSDPVGAPTSDGVLASLSAAADAARQAYMAALAASPPGADLSALYAKEMATLNAWSVAEGKALSADPSVPTLQADLDAQTKALRAELANFKGVASCLAILDRLVATATSLSTVFA